MALNLNESRLDKKRDATLDSAYTGVLERGMVMVYSGNVSATGEQMVIPSVGSTTEIVAGILWLSETSQESIPTIETLDIPSSAAYTVTLKNTPIGLTDLLVQRTDTNAELTVVAGAPGAGEVGLVGKILTADSALTGVEIRVTYRYTITAVELARRGGRRSVNQGAERLYALATLCYGNMRLMTSCFDVNVIISADPDVAANNVLRTAASGRVTVGGSNTVLGRCFQNPVLKLTPGIEQAFIGLECNVP